MTSAASAAVHNGLPRHLRGDKMLLGDLGHWHRQSGNHHSFVRGSLRACKAEMEAEPLTESDEALLDQVRAADEDIDPAPASDSMVDLVAAAAEDGKGVATEDVPLPFRNGAGEVVEWESDKPQRGGKRKCACDHGESRHNASGKCRTCDCIDFRVRLAEHSDL